MCGQLSPQSSIDAIDVDLCIEMPEVFTCHNQVATNPGNIPSKEAAETFHFEETPHDDMVLPALDEGEIETCYSNEQPLNISYLLSWGWMSPIVVKSYALCIYLYIYIYIICSLRRFRHSARVFSFHSELF